MIKILQITFESPSYFSGGGLGILQSSKSLLLTGLTDYCGPVISDNCKYLENKFQKLFILADETGWIGKTLAFINFVPSSLYLNWLNIRDRIDINNYDYVYIDFSRHYYIVKWAKKHNKKVIVRFHNIEYDYYKSALQRKWSIFALIKLCMIKYQEKNVIENADCLIFLTNIDLLRAKQIYGDCLRNKYIIINPVCLDSKNKYSYKPSKTGMIEFLITGSLWYGQNCDGIIWFLENVWKNLNLNNIHLTVAGNNPSNELKNFINKYRNASLVDSPKEMSYYFNSADCYIAPIFDGAGMKVKVAEALSYGLPIIGTTHAFIGYKTCNYCLIADDENTFISKILYFIDNMCNDNGNRKIEIINYFESVYSITKSKERIKGFINNA